jgi:ADP-dependent NAD(P)H-hydrate dehydratase / NAD(P)H-hydrate epimerase
MRIVTSDEMRKIDEVSANEYGIDSGILMENAGRAASQVLLEEFPDAGIETEIIVLAGMGNNAGDAFVIARRLLGVGRKVVTFYLSPVERYPAAVDKNLKILKALGAKLIPLESLPEFEEYLQRSQGPLTLVDGLFGTGLIGDLDGFLYDLVEYVNAGRFREIISLDIPSGVDGDNGLVRGTAIQATLTVSFGFPKVGHFLAPGASKCGRLVNVDISLPHRFRKMKEGQRELLSEGTIRPLLKPRDRYGHKNSFGHCLMIGGSTGRLGAIELAGKAAHRVGAGLITIATWSDCLPLLMARMPSEMMAFEIPADLEVLQSSQSILKSFSSIVIGPGLGMTPESEKLLETLLSCYQGPLVIDADAINIISEKKLSNALVQRRAPTVLTPHLGEMARLLQTSVPMIKEDLFSALKAAMDQTHSVMVMKGASTLVGAPDDSVFLNHLPNDGLATAGSGDVLAGMIGGFMAQGYSAFDSALIGVRLHAMAGKIAAAKVGSRSMTASDLVETIRESFIETGKKPDLGRYPTETRSYLY